MFVSRAQWLLTAPGTPGCFGDFDDSDSPKMRVRQFDESSPSFARAGFDAQFQRMAAEKATLYDSGGDSRGRVCH